MRTDRIGKKKKVIKFDIYSSRYSTPFSHPRQHFSSAPVLMANLTTKWHLFWPQNQATFMQITVEQLVQRQPVTLINDFRSPSMAISLSFARFYYFIFLIYLTIIWRLGRRLNSTFSLSLSVGRTNRTCPFAYACSSDRSFVCSCYERSLGCRSLPRLSFLAWSHQKIAGWTALLILNRFACLNFFFILFYLPQQPNTMHLLFVAGFGTFLLLSRFVLLYLSYLIWRLRRGSHYESQRSSSTDPLLWKFWTWKQVWL